MSDYAARLRRYNRAGQVQYEWFDEAADYIEELEEKRKEALLYWYNQGYFDAFMEMNEEKKDE